VKKHRRVEHGVVENGAAGEAAAFAPAAFSAVRCFRSGDWPTPCKGGRK